MKITIGFIMVLPGEAHKYMVQQLEATHQVLKALQTAALPVAAAAGV